MTKADVLIELVVKKKRYMLPHILRKTGVHVTYEERLRKIYIARRKGMRREQILANAPHYIVCDDGIVFELQWCVVSRYWRIDHAVNESIRSTHTEIASDYEIQGIRYRVWKRRPVLYNVSATAHTFADWLVRRVA